MEPASNSIGKGVDQQQLQNSLPTGKPKQKARCTQKTALIPEKRQSTNLRIMKLSDKAIVPTKGSQFAARHDIYALTDVLVPEKGQTMVETGIEIGLPEGKY